MSEYDYSDIKYLIQELTSFNNEAWEYFLRKYGRLIYKCINESADHNVSQETREDIFQEVIALLLDNNGKKLKMVNHKEEKPFRSYLWMVTHRHTHNFFRGKKKKKERELLPIDNIEILDISPVPDTEVFRRQLEKIIAQKLDLKERLVVLYFLEGLILAEIAANMDISLATAHNIKEKAISKIKKYLNNDEKIFECRVS